MPRHQRQDLRDPPIAPLRAGGDSVYVDGDEQEIIERVVEWAGGRDAAYVWYRSQAIPSLGHLTPERLVQSGRAALVRRYLERFAEGGFA